jgi:hypothetical protein
MKLYKLWLEIEELDTATGVHTNLSEQGRAEPVPVAVFTDLDQARMHAEAFAMDSGVLRRPWLSPFGEIN